MDGLTPTTLRALFDEIEAALAEVPGLRVGVWGNALQVPGAFVSLPESVERMSYRSVKFNDLVVTVVAGRANNKAALTQIMTLTGQVAQTLDTRRWDSVDDVSVTRIEFDTVTMNGAPEVYLAAFFHFDIAGA